MIVNSALENSGVSDSHHGKAIFVSTTARLAFRHANPGYATVRNKDLNYQIAHVFSQAEPIDYFRPSKDADDVVGEVREGASSKFIALIYSSHVSIIAVKKAPKIPDPISNIPLTSSLKQQITKKAKHNTFFTNHFYDAIESKYNLSESVVKELVKYLAQFHDGDYKATLKMLLTNKDDGVVEQMLGAINQKELATTKIENSFEPMSPFAVPAGEII